MQLCRLSRMMILHIGYLNAAASPPFPLNLLDNNSFSSSIVSKCNKCLHEAEQKSHLFQLVDRDRSKCSLLAHSITDLQAGRPAGRRDIDKDTWFQKAGQPVNGVDVSKSRYNKQVRRSPKQQPTTVTTTTTTTTTSCFRCKLGKKAGCLEMCFLDSQ